MFFYREKKNKKMNIPKVVCQDCRTIKGCLFWTDRYNNIGLEKPSVCEDCDKVFFLGSIKTIQRSTHRSRSRSRSHSPIYSPSPESKLRCRGCREGLGNQQAHMDYGGCGYESDTSSPIDI